jgi:WD40 repeat protein
LDEQGNSTVSLGGAPAGTLARGVDRMLLLGERLVALGGTTRVTVSGLEGGESRQVDVPADHPEVLAVSPGGRQIAVREWQPPDRPSELSVFTLATGERWEVETGDADLPDLSFSPDGRLLLVSGKQGDEHVTALWTAEGKKLATHTGYVESAAFTPATDRVALGTLDGLVVLGADGAELETLLADGPFGGESVHAVAWSPDAGSLAAGLSRGAVVVFGRDRAATTLPGPAVDIKEVAFSPSGDLIAAGNEAGTLLVWRSDGRAVASVGAHDGRVLALAFTPSGDIVTTGVDGAIRAFTEDGGPLWALAAESSVMRELRVTRDGRWLLTNVGDGRWLLARGREWRRLHLGDSELLAAARAVVPLPLTRAQARLLER